MNKRIIRARSLGLFWAGIIALVFSGPAQGSSVLTYEWDAVNTGNDIVTYSFTSGNPRAAQASFAVVSSDQLQITLTNTSTHDVLIPEEILTAIFFDIDSGSDLNPNDALLGSGSAVYEGSTMVSVPNGDVSGEWAYGKDVPTLPADYCISSVGLDDLLGPKDRFDTSMNLAGPESPDGMQYGIVSAGDDPTTGNGGVASNPLIRDSVVLTMDGLGTDFDLGGISNVWFHYGTSYTSPLPPPPSIPEPATFMAFIMGAGALTRYARRRSMKKERV